MTTSARQPRVAYADYLARESDATVKREYLRGEVWAMAGGTPEHARLAARMISALSRLLHDRPCEVFSSDVRVRIEATDLATYPDATVVCDRIERAGDDGDAITNPMLLVEVLSDSTEAYDRGEKWAHYQHIASLQAYLLVSQHGSRIEAFQRTADGWRYAEARAGQELTLECLGGAIDVDALYRSALQ